MALQARNYIDGAERAVVVAGMVEKQTPLTKLISNDVKNKLQPGDSLTIGIKIPGRGHIVKGVVTQADFLVRTNAIRKITVSKKTSPDKITELDDSSTIEEWNNEVLQPISEVVATDINRAVYAAILQGVDSAIVSDAVGSGKFQDLSDSIASVRNSRVSGRISGVLGNSLMSQVRNSGANLFTGGTIAGELYRGFDIATYGEADFIGTPDATDVILPGTFPASVGASVAHNATRIPCAALSEDVPAGVLFTIEGVNRVDAEGNELKGERKVFASAETPAGSSFINISQQIIYTPDVDADGNTLTQVKNVSKLPESGDVITMLGTPGKIYMTGVIFAEKIAVNVNRPLSDRGKKDAGKVATTTIAGLNSIQTWERPEIYNGDTLFSVSRLDAQAPLLGIGGTAYYVRKYA